MQQTQLPPRGFVHKKFDNDFGRCTTTRRLGTRIVCLYADIGIQGDARRIPGAEGDSTTERRCTQQLWSRGSHTVARGRKALGNAATSRLRTRIYTDANSDDDEEANGPFELCEATGTFLEAAFKKLDNAQRKKKLAKFGTDDSRWVRCPKLDPVVTTNVGREATRDDRSSSRLHQCLLIQ